MTSPPYTSTDYFFNVPQDFCNDCFIECHSPGLRIGTPPLDEIRYEPDQSHPYSCMYVLNLFLTPNIPLYLQETPISDTVYDLPIHMQKVVAEARMEALLMKQNGVSKTSALEKLERLRSYVTSISGHDSSLIINTVHELMKDEDELNCVIGE